MSTDICPLTPAAKNGWIGIHSPSVWQIEWQSGVNGQAVHFYQIANRGEGAVSVSTLNKRSKRGSAIRLLSGGSVDRFPTEQADSNRTCHVWKWPKTVVQFCLYLQEIHHQKIKNIFQAVICLDNLFSFCVVNHWVYQRFLSNKASLPQKLFSEIIIL